MADKALFSDVRDELLEIARNTNDVELALVAVGTKSAANYLFELVQNADKGEELPYQRLIPAIKANHTRANKVSLWLRREEKLADKANRAIIDIYKQELALLDSFSRAALLEIVKGVPPVDEKQTQLDLGTESKKPKSTTKK